MSEPASRSSLHGGVIVLAVIGALALLAAAGMGVMHGLMMGGGFGC